MVKTQGFQALLNYPDNFKFDIILYDYTCGPCLLGFLHRFGYPPLIGVSAFSNPPFTGDLIGGHNYYAYKPYYSLYLNENMTFWERSYNSLVHFMDYWYVILYESPPFICFKDIFNNCLYRHRNYVLIPKLDEITAAKFGSNIPSTFDLEKRTTLALVSTHPSFDVPEPLPPNVIPVAGLHILESKPLPATIESFINGSKKGAVLFSLGTNVRSDMMDVSIQQKLLDAFGRMPEYNFLWKFEGTASTIAIPKNVLIQAWLPQSDILAHPKTKAFFTHSGLLSVQEAIWHGVPMIGMPFIYDQHRVSRQIVLHSYIFQ